MTCELKTRIQSRDIEDKKKRVLSIIHVLAQDELDLSLSLRIRAFSGACIDRQPEYISSRRMIFIEKMSFNSSAREIETDRACKLVIETQDLNVIIAKYYLPNELFVDQVEAVIGMLTDCLTARFPYTQAVNRAHHFVARYYLNIAEAEACNSLFPEKQMQNQRKQGSVHMQLTERPSCFGSLNGACPTCNFYGKCLRQTNDEDLRRVF